MQQGHEGRSHGLRLEGDARRLTQQEDVVSRVRSLAAIDAEDRQHVGTVVGQPAVEHVDEVVALAALAAGGVDLHRVGAGLAIDRQRVGRCRTGAGGR